jgi:hypothetical protein
VGRLMRVRDRPQDRSTERRPIQRQESIQGAALSIEDAIAYVQRGRGERKRPSSGWASLTPTEMDVARLVSEGSQTNRSPHSSLYRPAPYRPTSPTSTPNSASPHAYNWRKRQRATPDVQALDTNLGHGSSNLADWTHGSADSLGFATVAQGGLAAPAWLDC